MNDELKEIINSLLENYDKLKIKKLTEITKTNPELLLLNLNHIFPIFLLQTQQKLFSLFIEKKYSEIQKILEFFFNLTKNKETLKVLIEVNMHNSLNFLLVVCPNIDEASKGLCLMILSEMLNTKELNDPVECFSVLIETINLSNDQLKNLSFLTAKKILAKSFKEIMEKHEKKFAQCFEKDLCKMLKEKKFCLNGLDCLDFFLEKSEYKCLDFPEIFENKFINNLDFEHKKRLLEIKRRF